MEMDNEELLQRTFALAKENNVLLKKLRHSSWIALFFKLIFWAVALGVPLWLYFNVLQPVVGQSMSVLEQVKSIAGQAQDATGKAGATATEVQGLMESIPGVDTLKKLIP